MKVPPEMEHQMARRQNVEWLEREHVENAVGTQVCRVSINPSNEVQAAWIYVQQLCSGAQTAKKWPTANLSGHRANNSLP